MDKKTVTIGIIILVLIIIVLGAFFLLSRENEPNKTKENYLGKTIVIYYSATNNTKKVAKQIANNLDCDLFEVVPKDKYTSDDLNYNDNNSRVYKEYNNEALRDIKLNTTKIDNWEQYDTVIIGYPIWWGIAAWPMSSFVKNIDFDGKNIIPFCTSASSDIGESDVLLKEAAASGTWKKGIRFSSNVSDKEIKNWTDSLINVVKLVK